MVFFSQHKNATLEGQLFGAASNITFWSSVFFVFPGGPRLNFTTEGGGVPHEAQGPTHLRLQVQPEPATLAGVCCERRSRKNLDVVQSGASTGHCRRASIGLRLKCKSLVRNGNQFTEGLRALWSGGSTQFIPTGPVGLAPDRTLDSVKFSLGCRGYDFESSKFRGCWS